MLKWALATVGERSNLLKSCRPLTSRTPGCTRRTAGATRHAAHTRARALGVNAAVGRGLAAHARVARVCRVARCRPSALASVRAARISLRVYYMPRVCGSYATRSAVLGQSVQIENH